MINDYTFNLLQKCTTILRKAGGPERACSMFELHTQLIDNILKSYHLPSIKKYENILFNFINRKCNLIDTRNELSLAREAYLISRPNLITELLEQIKRGQITSYEALKEMNYDTNTYSCFICDLLTNDNASIQDVLNDLKLIDQSPELTEILYFLRHKNYGSSKTPLYYFIEKSGLKLFGKYLKEIGDNDKIRLSNIELLEGIIDTNHYVYFLATQPNFNDGKPFTITVSLYDLLYSSEPDHPTQLLIDRIVENERMNRDEPISIDFRHFYKSVVVSNEVIIHKLEIEDEITFAESYSLIAFENDKPTYNVVFE